jgi:hypothetical protein
MPELVHAWFSDGTELTLSGANDRVPVGTTTETTTRIETPDRDAIASVLGTTAANGRVDTSPFLFEQTNYQITLSLSDGWGADACRLLIGGKDVLPAVRSHRDRRWIETNLNFGSEIGFTRLEFWRGNALVLRLHVEVFPTKIDYKSDFYQLRADLQSEVRALVFALQGRTFQRWTRRRVGQSPTAIEWLNQLGAVFDDMVMAIERIVRVPRERVEVEHRLVQASRPVRASSEARRHLRNHLGECRAASGTGVFSAHGKRWSPREMPDARRHLTPDTQENRFVVAALQQVHAKIRSLQARARVETVNLGEWPKFLERGEREITRLRCRTWLAEVPAAAHGMQPTLALHLAPGYREFHRAWIALSATLEVGGGPMEMRERDVATLYEMWCFVALARLLRREFGLGLKSAPWLQVDRRGISVRLTKGRESTIVQVDATGRTFHVSYNHGDPTPTGRCIPDNTLTIVQSGGGRGFRYIFDAKYRVETDQKYLDDYGAPGPPVDAIQRMHAYRDQIVTKECRRVASAADGAVVWDLGARRRVQCTVGAFVLFPYDGPDADRNTFFKAITDVGVGSVPFLPKRQSEVAELVRRIARHSEETIEDAMVALSTEEDRRRIEAAHELGLLAIVKNPAQWIFICNSRIYHMPYRRDRQLRLRAEFVVFVGSLSKFGASAGLLGWAQIRSVRFGARHAIEPAPPTDEGSGSPDSNYVWFEVGNIQPPPRSLPVVRNPPEFALTNRLALDQASTDIFDLLLVREPERRLVQELRAAGLAVRVYDETSSVASPFDLASLRLKMQAADPVATPRREISVRFDPVAARFSWLGGEATWSELMFESERVIANIRKGLATP